MEKHVASSAHYQPQSYTTQSPAAAPPINAVSEDGHDEKAPEKLDERIRSLMTQAKVVLFMKGSPDAPRCGFSRKIVGLLRDQNVQFSHFDILTDEDVRQGTFTLMNFHCLGVILITPARRVEKAKRLADVPAAHRQRRVCGRVGYRTGDGRQWRVGRDHGIIVVVRRIGLDAPRNELFRRY